MKIENIEKELEKIHQDLLDIEPLARKLSEPVHRDYSLSALNLVRYISLRNYDLRYLHDSLSELGISALRSSEAYVWRNVTDALKLVKLIRGESWSANSEIASIGYKKSKKLIRKHSNHLFNARDQKHRTEIMVTMPAEAAEDRNLVAALITEGMEIARINLSHGDLDEWTRTVTNIKLASRALKKPCKIYMDLAGPKLRTGLIAIKSKDKKGKTVMEDHILLSNGDHLVLTKGPEVSKKARYGKSGELKRPARLAVSLPSIIDDVHVGDRILFDDGKIEGSIIQKSKREVEVVIRNTPRKIKLKSEKGINLPDSDLRLPSLTKEDIKNLPFVVQNADMVGYSFVRSARDVDQLYEQLSAYESDSLGIIFKIENKEAFDDLPLILLNAMRRPAIGVMIARGDLAVELGAERIAEVQDQILWICEAAHVPVIWATQVLENLSKTGKVSRAEITDAAKSARAECVMLNKGPYVVDSVRLLKRILFKMESHTTKKKSTMRALVMAQKVLMKMKEQING
ncbi:MAG: pyruvate kinase [Saprospiraceae bacterium]|nr:pyruvate kinase [Saprospiraceae bacterium]